MKIYNKEQAMNFFLSNSSGKVICIKDNKEKECNSYPEAVNFFEEE